MFKGIDDTIVNGVPEYVLALFQGKFAIITPALISGALAFRKVTPSALSPASWPDWWPSPGQPV